MVARLDIIASGFLFLAGGFTIELFNSHDGSRTENIAFSNLAEHECVVPAEAIGDWSLPGDTSEYTSHLIIYCDGRYVDYVTAPIREGGGEILPDCAYLAELSGGRLVASIDRISFVKDVSGRQLPECDVQLDRTYMALHETDQPWFVSMESNGNTMVLSSLDDLSMRFQRVQ